MLFALQTMGGSDLICLRAIFWGLSEAGWEACGTAGGCELMLLTLGNEEQTWTMDTGGRYGGWERGKLKKKKKELVRKGWKQLFHCGGHKNTHSRKGLDDVCQFKYNNSGTWT